MGEMWSSLTNNYGAILSAVFFACAVWSVSLLPFRLIAGSGMSLISVLEDFLLFGFAAFLGIAVGYLTGMSRIPSTGAIVPSVLTLVGALVGFLFASDRPTSPVRQVGILSAALTLLVAFFFATFAASERRQEWDRYMENVELYKLQYQSQLKVIEMEYAARLAERKSSRPAAILQLNE